MIIGEKGPLPNMGRQAAIPRAHTKDLTQGMPQGGKDELRFTAPGSGTFRIICGVPGHAVSGIKIFPKVDPSAKAPSWGARRFAGRRVGLAMTHHSGPVVLTVGHSTRPLGTFITLLQAHAVERLVDVRTVPRSRHNPQFNRDTLPAALANHGIGYEHEAGLGGLRHTHAGSLNTGWRNLSFRGYADYMQTAEFTESLSRLITTAGRERIVLMCAEAMPWRCHRSLIGDALLVHGLRVEDILSHTRTQVHKLTRFARVDGLTLTYPPEASSLPQLELPQSAPEGN